MDVINNIKESIKALSRMQQDSEFAYVSSLGKYFLLFSSSIGIIFIFMSLYPDTYKYVIREDGPVEYISALFWLLSALTVFITVSLTKSKSKYFYIAYALLFAFFIACCGEEISWGQRIFGFKGPDAIIELNKQKEFNLHNIGSISIFSNSFFLITLGVFLVYPALLIQNKKVRILVRDNKLPVVVFYAVANYLIILAIWIFIGIRFGTLGFHPFSVWGYYTQMDDELFEFFAAYSFFTFAFFDLLFKSRHTVLTNQ